jgi:DNA mismatch repair protein MutS
VGDFYETFGEDAVRASKILGIALTKRGAGSETETALAGSASFKYLFAKTW